MFEWQHASPHLSDADTGTSSNLRSHLREFVHVDIRGLPVLSTLDTLDALISQTSGNFSWNLDPEEQNKPNQLDLGTDPVHLGN